MVWKVKELREFLADKHDEDVVEFGHYCQSKDNLLYFERFSVRTRKPKRTEFNHEDCEFCEEITIKNNKKLYCCKKDDILHDDESCNNFQHKKYELEYSN